MRRLRHSESIYLAIRIFELTSRLHTLLFLTLIFVASLTVWQPPCRRRLQIDDVKAFKLLLSHWSIQHVLSDWLIQITFGFDWLLICLLSGRYEHQSRHHPNNNDVDAACSDAIASS